MKVTLRTTLVILLIPLGLVACSGSENEPFTNFSDESQQVLPVFNAVEGLLRPDATRAQTDPCGGTTDWACDAALNGQGHMAFQLYRLLANPEDDPAISIDDLPAWGVENLYNNLSHAGLAAEGLTGEAAGAATGTSEDTGYSVTYEERHEFDPPQSIPPPFPYFTDLYDVTYRYWRTADLVLSNGSEGPIDLAWKIEGPLTNLLMGHTLLQPDEDTEKEIIEGQSDGGTGNLLLNVAMNVGEFIMRMDVSGNTGDHSFLLKFIKLNPSELGYNLSLVGTGVSRGEDEYFLFKERHWTTGTGPSTMMWYCISAETTKKQFGIAYNENGDFLPVSGYIEVSGGTPAAGWCGGSTYEDDISELNVPLLADDDLPTSAEEYDSDFLSD
jgi:hypothetical protein